MNNRPPTFQHFWSAYQLKRDKIAAERAWRKLSADDRMKAIEGIAAYSNDCERRGIRRMYAQGYLNHRRWEDDFTDDDEPKPVYVVKPSKDAPKPGLPKFPENGEW